MTKLYNTSFREQEGKYFIDYYTEPKPYQVRYYDGSGNFDSYNYDFDVDEWQKSKQSIEIHKSQVEGFMQLAAIQSKKEIGSFKQGIEIPDGMVEIKYLHNLNFGAIKYAFLKQETKESDLAYTTANMDRNIRTAVEEESQDALWAQIIFEADWYDGTPNGLTKLIEHLKTKFKITKK